MRGGCDVCGTMVFMNYLRDEVIDGYTAIKSL